jgi:hypothetical protein
MEATELLLHSEVTVARIIIPLRRLHVDIPQPHLHRRTLLSPQIIRPITMESMSTISTHRTIIIRRRFPNASNITSLGFSRGTIRSRTTFKRCSR